MIRPVPFLVLSALLVVAIGSLAGYIPAGDPFASPTGIVREDLVAAPLPTLAELKRRHGGAEEPFDIGLFGNSRALAVSGADIGLRGCRFFNFSLSGQSLRSSVALVESLAAMNRLPRRILVSFDNLSLQFYGNPEWPPIRTRWRLAAEDAVAPLVRDDIGARDWLRMMWRHLLTEGSIFRSHFELSFVMAGATFLTNSAPSVPEERAYRSDGSLPYGRFSNTGHDVTVPASQILAGYLRADLERLARIGGDRVTVYESPLAPRVARRLAVHPTGYVEADRQAFLGACRQFGLACRAAPIDLAADRQWPEVSHPPVGALGGYLRDLVKENPPVCADDL